MQSSSDTRPRGQRIYEFLKNPSRRTEIILWILLAVSVIGIRAYFIHKLPVVLWSKDGGSYAFAPFYWFHQHIWHTDPRRGAIYSLFIWLCAATTNGLNSIMVAQHFLGAVAVIVSIVALRVMCGRAALIPVALCGYAYGMYGLPLYVEHLVRNETLLFFFGSLAFAGWLFSIKLEQPQWLLLSGISAALLHLTKSVLGPFPLMVIAASWWFYRSTPRLALKQIAIFIVAFLLPIVGDKMFKHFTMHSPPEPQAGILLYGRTAQFTNLDGGIEPEVKKEIAQQVLDYRTEVFGTPEKPIKPPALNNNEVLKQTIIPHLRDIVKARGGLPADVEKLCRKLAFEAIMTHKKDYAKQVLRDLNRLEFRVGARIDSPKASEMDSDRTSDLREVAEVLRTYKDPDPLMKVRETVAVLEAPERQNRKYFSLFHHWTASAWLFRIAPVFLTTLLLPLFIFFTPGKMRGWWLGAAAVFYFTLVLLCTVGRPLDRYLIPAVPVMFWTLGAGFVWLWNQALNFIAKKYDFR